LTTILLSHAASPAPGPAGSGRARTFPRCLLPDTDCRIAKKTEQGPVDERPLYD